MSIELIIFDWGGTLAEVARQPEALHRGACAVGRVLTGMADETVAAELAARALNAEAAAAADPEHREVNLRELLAEWARDRGLGEANGDRIDAAVRAIGEHWVGGALEPIPGALEALGLLRQRGYRLGLLSNCSIPPDFCQQELARQGFAAMMDFAVYSSAVGYRKPSRSIYDAALEAAFPAGRPAELSGVLFVGDSPSCDVTGPAKLGMKTVMVSAKPGLWSDADYVNARPDLRLATVADLPAAIETLG